MNNSTHDQISTEKILFGKQQILKLWDNIDMTKNLYSRLCHINKVFTSILRDLSADSDIKEGPGERANRINWIANHHAKGFPGSNTLKEIHEARIMLGKFITFSYNTKENNGFVTEKDLEELNLDENAFADLLRKISSFFAWVYDLQIPDHIRGLYEEKSSKENDEIPAYELEKVTDDDLNKNKSYRFNFITIIDNSISMGENHLLEKLQQNLTTLEHEINRSTELSRRVELYMATCGGGPTEIVDFAMIERQILSLDQLILRPYGRCCMAATINKALDKLQIRLDKLNDPKCDIKYYRPWMLILTNGNFKDDMKETMARIKRDFGFIQIYARGLSPDANMDNLRTLDPNAAILDSLDGFFKDVFVSLRRVKYSIPGGERIHLVNQSGYTEQT